MSLTYDDKSTALQMRVDGYTHSYIAKVLEVRIREVVRFFISEDTKYQRDLDRKIQSGDKGYDDIVVNMRQQQEAIRAATMWADRLGSARYNIPRKPHHG